MKDTRLLAVGAKVREFRVALGLSQEQLADLAGIDRTYISGIERGVRNITLLKLFLLADVFKMSPKDFLPNK